MTLSPPIDERPNTRHSCWLAAGSDQTRIGSLNWPAVAPSIGSCNMRFTHFHQSPTASITLKRVHRPQRPNLSKPEPVAKSP